MVDHFPLIVSLASSPPMIFFLKSLHEHLPFPSCCTVNSTHYVQSRTHPFPTTGFINKEMNHNMKCSSSLLSRLLLLLLLQNCSVHTLEHLSTEPLPPSLCQVRLLPAPLILQCKGLGTPLLSCVPI